MAIDSAIGSSNSRGKNAGAVNSSTNVSGNRFWSSESDPVRSAIADARPARIPAVRAPSTIAMLTPATPPEYRAPKMNATPRKTKPCTTPSAQAATTRPRTIVTRGSGAVSSRSKKPPSMSPASAIPAVRPASSAPCISVPPTTKPT